MISRLKSLVLYLHCMQFEGFTSDYSLAPWTKHTYHTHGSQMSKGLQRAFYLYLYPVA